jgi:hypothetical protein
MPGCRSGAGCSGVNLALSGRAAINAHDSPPVAYHLADSPPGANYQTLLPVLAATKATRIAVVMENGRRLPGLREPNANERGFDLGPGYDSCEYPYVEVIESVAATSCMHGTFASVAGRAGSPCVRVP